MSQLEPDTFAAKFLHRHPDVRKKVMDSPSFREWHDALPVVEVDGQNFRVTGGDQLRDADQIIFDWAWMAGLVTQDEVDALRWGG